LIADDHSILRAGLISLLNAESEMEVVGEAYDEVALSPRQLKNVPMWC